MRWEVVIARAIALIVATVTMASELLAKDEFEGCISYRVKAVPRMDHLKARDIIAAIGTQWKECYKQGNYRITPSDGPVEMILYRWDKNTEYTLMRKNKRLWFFRCAHNPKKVKEVVAVLATEQILGRPVKSLIIRFQDKTETQYWYDEGLRVNPTWFKKMRFSGLNLYFEKARALPLKYENRGRAYTSTFTAIQITRQKLSDKLFQIPNRPLHEWDLR